MKYIKLFEDIDKEDEFDDGHGSKIDHEESQSDEEVQGQSEGEYSELIKALSDCIDKTSQCAEHSEETDESDGNRCMEGKKVCETTLWCVENQSKYWKNMLEYCLPVCRELIEYCLKKGPETPIDALMVFVDEAEKVIDGE